MPVEKRADALVHVTVQLLATGLELQGYSFSLGNEFVYLLFAQRHGVSLAVFIVVCTVWGSVRKVSHIWKMEVAPQIG